MNGRMLMKSSGMPAIKLTRMEQADLQYKVYANVASA